MGVVTRAAELPPPLDQGMGVWLEKQTGISISTHARSHLGDIWRTQCSLGIGIHPQGDAST